MKLKEAREAINAHTKDLIERCPHCGAMTHIEALWNQCHILPNRDAEFYVVFRCKPCRKLILKTLYLRQSPYSQQENFEIAGWKETFPVSLEDELRQEELQFIPSEVLSDYQEALKCKSIAANRASCAMFRRSLQAALVGLGADPQLDLIKQIESVENLPRDVKDWAHQIRIFGNWGAHPDKDNLKDIDDSDVSEAHDFMSKFLLYMFIMPQKVRLAREKREKKVSGSTPDAERAKSDD